MARRIEDDIYSVDQLRDRISIFLPILHELGITDLYMVKSFAPDNRIYAYFTNVKGEVTDRIYYLSEGKVCDHVVSGSELIDIYNDLNYVVVNYIFGYVSGF